ncbi:hypothetical protein LCGC14_0655770 [marine sediment metagenome]|uniref:Uncharacterized protein n=1 Tax=marine sediment metagenome TaxID=412755 RepID=A0A0F9U3A0_9ZZZZ
MTNFFAQRRLQDLGILAIAVILVQVLLSRWIYPLFGQTTQQLFSITPAQAVASPTIGNKIIGFLSGIVPFDLGSLGVWVSIFLGTFILLMVGYWVYEWKWVWKGKNVYQRLWAILLYGTAALYVFLLITKLGVVSVIAFPLLIGVGINYLIIAFVVSALAKRFKFLRI